MSERPLPVVITVTWKGETHLDPELHYSADITRIAVEDFQKRLREFGWKMKSLDHSLRPQ